jgi:hypothetical protein
VAWKDLREELAEEFEELSRGGSARVPVDYGELHTHYVADERGRSAERRKFEPNRTRAHVRAYQLRQRAEDPEWRKEYFREYDKRRRRAGPPKVEELECCGGRQMHFAFWRRKGAR